MEKVLVPKITHQRKKIFQLYLLIIKRFYFCISFILFLHRDAIILARKS